MSTPPLDLVRSIDVEPGDGRTLTGVAFKYDTPSLVRDPGAPAYLEEFSRSSADKTIAQRGPVPLMVLHADHRLPIGVATFERGQDGLDFTARVSETKDGDDILTLVNDGALRSVSVRFRAFGSRQRMTARGKVTTRTEIGLRELSLVPSGFGAHDGAEVLAVRSELEAAGTPRLDALRKRRALLIIV